MSDADAVAIVIALLSIAGCLTAWGFGHAVMTHLHTRKGRKP